MYKLRLVSYIAWLFLGAFFVFSALAKGLDFFAVAVKIQDYTQFFNISVPRMFYGVGSVVLIGTELLIGLLLITGVFRRCVYFIMLVVLIFFLVLTFSVAISDSFEDCGCFGSVLSTSPWISFTKNVILLLFVILAYPQSLYKTVFKYSDLIICVSLVLFLCGFSLFNQPLVDSSKLSVGESLYINKDIRSSIDVDFVPDTMFDVSCFGAIQCMDDDVVSEALQSLANSDGKPTIITSEVPKNVNPKIYDFAIVGFMDNNTLKHLVSTEFGIITLDEKSRIVHKWQKDYLNLQFFERCEDNSFSIGRIAYWSVWIVILVVSICFLVESIKRGLPKNASKSRR